MIGVSYLIVDILLFFSSVFVYVMEIVIIWNICNYIFVNLNCY